MAASKLSARRPTESSKALSATKDRTLSAVTLTKRTNSLVFDVEEIKSHVKDLQAQGHEVVQQEQTVQDLTAKVTVLQDAFGSLSDVCICVEDAQKKMSDGFSDLVQRVERIEKSVVLFQSQALKADAKRKHLQESTERRFSDFEEAFSKLLLSVYDTQAELGRVKHSTDDLLAREREATHLTQSLQATQEQATDWLQKLKLESSQLQTEMLGLKEHTGATDVTLTNDVQYLAKECSSMRSLMNQQNAQWLNKLETLRETLDRQNKVDKNQISQRLDAMGETVNTNELRTRDAVSTLLKNHTKIREAVDESMSICSSEIRILSQECRTVHDDQRMKLEVIVQQLAQQEHVKTEWRCGVA